MISIRQTCIDVTSVLLLGLVIYLATAADSIKKIVTLPDSIYQMNMLFLSILIEALPFVLIGVLLAGFIQIFVTEAHIEKWIPKNRFLAITMSCIIGALFPACECGIVPIVRRLVSKGVPIYAGIGFLLTGPLINPIVILSTYMAFGNSMKIALARMIIGFAISMVIATIISFFYKGSQLRNPTASQIAVSSANLSFTKKLGNTLTHSVDEFFDMGKFLIFGALAAAFFQTYIATGDVAAIGTGVASSTIVMMGLAFLLSLCSEADAFIGASFSNIFPIPAVLGFLIYGPMIDLKNTFMMLSVFKSKFVIAFLVIVTGTVFLTLMLLQGLL